MKLKTLREPVPGVGTWLILVEEVPYWSEGDNAEKHIKDVIVGTTFVRTGTVMD